MYLFSLLHISFFPLFKKSLVSQNARYCGCVTLCSFIGKTINTVLKIELQSDALNNNGYSAYIICYSCQDTIFACWRDAPDLWQTEESTTFCFRVNYFCYFRDNKACSLQRINSWSRDNGIKTKKIVANTALLSFRRRRVRHMINCGRTFSEQKHWESIKFNQHQWRRVRHAARSLRIYNNILYNNI